MISSRIIPCLLLQNDGVYKTTKFKNPKYIGDPLNTAKIFNDKEVDELIVLDILASRNKTINFDLIQQLASECFMPLSYGGGISSINDSTTLFNIGVEKIILQSSILSDYYFLKSLSSRFGSQSIVASIDIKKDFLGRYKVYSHLKKKFLSIDILDLLKSYEIHGVGEIFLNFVDRDGMMSGLDLEIVRKVSSLISVPLVVCGGVGHISHIRDGLLCGASGVSGGSFFVYHGPHRAVLISYPSITEINNLKV